MLREVKEETGLTVEKWNYRGIVTFISDTWENEYMHLFTATGWQGEPTDCDEGELAWVEKGHLEELSLGEGDKLFLRLLQDEGRAFFSLKLVYRNDELHAAWLDTKPLALPE